MLPENGLGLFSSSEAHIGHLVALNSDVNLHDTVTANVIIIMLQTSTSVPEINSECNGMALTNAI